MKHFRRSTSFFIMAVIYIIVTVFGIFLYRILPGAIWQRLLAADVAATALCFIFSLIFQNASVYDPYWSVQPIVILTGYAFLTTPTPLRVLLLIAVWFWGVRLTANWAYTFHGLDHQDWRYTMLHEKTGKFYPVINFVGIHLVPTLVVYGTCLPAVYAFTEQPVWNPLSILFICVSIGAATMQGIADIQMHRFRKNRTTPFIRVGLWKNSRHPNYLGEILMWWGIALSVICSMPQYWYLAAGAFANTLLFLCVSIPMADGRQSRKEGFEEYRRSTRMLLPLPKH